MGFPGRPVRSPEKRPGGPPVPPSKMPKGPNMSPNKSAGQGRIPGAAGMHVRGPGPGRPGQGQQYMDLGRKPQQKPPPPQQRYG